MGHPHIARGAEVRARAQQGGHIDMTRQRFGPECGLRHIGVSRFVVAPGATVTPLHVHLAEDEAFYVVAGSGVNVRGEQAHPVAAGDAVLHEAAEDAHTFVAGPDGLEVVALGAGTTTPVTMLPRAGVWWARRQWLPTGGQHPVELEIEAGPLELPEPETERSDRIVRADEAPVSPKHPGWRDVGLALGAERLGFKLVRLDSGAWSSNPHWHTAKEEAFAIVEGRGVVELGAEEHPLQAGDVLGRPAGSGVSHRLRAGEDGMVYLAFSDRPVGDAVVYPERGVVRLAPGVVVPYVAE